MLRPEIGLGIGGLMFNTGRDCAVGSMPATDGARINGRLALQGAHRVMGVSKRDHVKALLIAEDFAADSGS